jgi:hypothetical protein
MYQLDLSQYGSQPLVIDQLKVKSEIKKNTLWLSPHVSFIESTRLYSNRPQMKVIKNVMHKRPKKHRHSDIHRRNLNKNVCITKIPEWFLIPDYTIESEESKHLLNLLHFFNFVSQLINKINSRFNIA